MEWAPNGVDLYGRWATWKKWAKVPSRQNHRYVYMATALQLGVPVMHALNMHGGFKNHEGHDMDQLAEALDNRLIDAGYEYMNYDDDSGEYKRGEKCIYWSWTRCSMKIYIHEYTNRVQYCWKFNYTFTRTVRETVEHLTMNEFMDALSVDIE